MFFDALISVRPYKKAWSVEDACDYIIKNSGTMFDPKVVDVFKKNKIDGISDIYLKKSG